jgi:hypothetical protein
MGGSGARHAGDGTGDPVIDGAGDQIALGHLASTQAASLNRTGATRVCAVSSPAPVVTRGEILADQASSNTIAVATNLVPGPVGTSVQLPPPPVEFSRMVREADTGSYRLEQPQLVDPRGDAALISRIDSVPPHMMTRLINQAKRLKNFLLHPRAPRVAPAPGSPRAAALAAGLPTPAGRPDVRAGEPTPPLTAAKLPTADELVAGLRDVIRETGIAPHMTAEHKWSPQAEQYRHYGFVRRLGGFVCRKNSLPAPHFGASKLFLALVIGESSRYMPTGYEKALEERIAQYPDRGVQPADVLRESYLLNRGDLYGTLLTAENVLSRDRALSDRASRGIQHKLASLRSDLSEPGDNFGPWYHLFGMAVYSLVRSNWMANAVGRIEHAGSAVIKAADSNELHANMLGVRLGQALRAELERKPAQVSSAGTPRVLPAEQPPCP